MFAIFSNYSHAQKLIIASGVIGNLLETFDVMICAFLAQTIATTFFPSHSSINNLFYTFNIFLVGYLSRPIGSLFIGLYADQLGRKKMLVFSIIIVGLSTAIVGILPSYQSIGIASTILFLLFRILQNISVGGEYISSIAYLIESAKNNKRGFYGCWVSVGFNCGTLLASLFTFAVIYLIDAHILPTWSWRIVFLSAIIGMFAGFWIRRALPECIGFILENSTSQPRKKIDILKSSLALIHSHPYRCLSVAAIGWLGVSETATIYIYSPIHMTTINYFSQYTALGINCLSLLLLIVLIPIFGFLSDYFERTRMLALSCSAFLVLSFPYFWYLSYGNFTQILIAKLIFSIPSACFYSTAPVLITETFPLRLRCTSLALIYQVVASLAAGLTPIILLHLVHRSHILYSPAYFIAISSIFGLIGLYFLSNHSNRNIIPFAQTELNSE